MFKVGDIVEFTGGLPYITNRGKMPTNVPCKVFKADRYGYIGVEILNTAGERAEGMLECYFRLCSTTKISEDDFWIKE